MTEVWFYHLERARLEGVLPDLLDKTMARGWRALVKVGSEERLQALDGHLWTYRDDTFLPHGTAHEKDADRQPVLLTTAQANLNKAQLLFLVDGAKTDDFSGYERCISIFDGGDEAAVADARAFWKHAKAAGAPVAYWRQSPQGKWEKQA